MVQREMPTPIFLSHHPFLLLIAFAGVLISSPTTEAIRFPDRLSESPPATDHALHVAVFALGSFWRSEAIFGCLNGVVHTSVGYSGGSKASPEYRGLGDHAESVQSSILSLGFNGSRLSTIKYDPRVISYRQLLEVFWSSHDSRQVFGQGPDVGNQYRSIIFANGTRESKLATLSKEREQAKSKSSVVTTQIQPLETFYPAEPEHHKFELKRKPFLLHLIGNLPEEELQISTVAARVNSYAAELCPPRIQRQIEAKINDIVRKGWPVLREI